MPAVCVCVWVLGLGLAWLQAAVHAISDGLDDMIVDESARIAVITFDDAMHFYDLGVRTPDQNVITCNFPSDACPSPATATCLTVGAHSFLASPVGLHLASHVCLALLRTFPFVPLSFSAP